MADFQITGLDALIRSLGALPQQVEAAKEHALDVSAARALELKLGEVEKTYARPPGNWTRTGQFRDGQSIEGTTGERNIGVRGAAEAYEPRLANLPSDRRNPAAENASVALERELPDLFERAFRERLEQGR